ncbi:hypothetical protein GCM10027275_52160 [Rhabdobacter roseus]|uniref:Lipoprotein n=1 Tax=Rhabdobacter roseus TaxID=1655419 RepID=A0A840U5D6_9BACT|nr:hypothetical protein [Rhabdobacter roseus]MBB5287290.1 hypothetical protein [Rhabdobacter roseus]
MKRFAFNSLFLLLLATLAGCAIQPLGYFTTEPYTKPLPQKRSEPLTIVLREDVKDSLRMEGAHTQRFRMKLTDFRQTLQTSLRHTFSKNFEQVTFADTEPTQGLVLVIYRIRPLWRLGGTSTSDLYIEGQTQTVSESHWYALFQFESTLFRDGKQIQSADGQAGSELAMSSFSQAHAVFKNGLRVTCESLYRKLFTDDVLATIK